MVDLLSSMSTIRKMLTSVIGALVKKFKEEIIS